MAYVVISAIISGIFCCIGWIGIYNLIYHKLDSCDTTCLLLATISALITVLTGIALFIGIELRDIISFIVIGGISTIATFYCATAIVLQPFLFIKDVESPS